MDPKRFPNNTKRNKEALWPKFGGIECPHLWTQFIYPKIIRKSNNYNSRFYENIDHTIPKIRNAIMETMTSNNTNHLSNNNNVHIHVLNLHTIENPTTAIYCDVLKNKTPNTCHYSQNQHTPKVHHKGTVSYLYDMIVIEAANRNLIDTSIKTRYEARTDLEKYHTQRINKTYLDLPLMCPPQTQLQSLLDKSIRFENLVRTQNILDVVEDGVNVTKNEIEHTMKFWNSAINDRDYCWVNIQYLFDGGDAGKFGDGVVTKIQTWNDLQERLVSLSLPPVTIWSGDDEEERMILNDANRAVRKKKRRRRRSNN